MKPILFPAGQTDFTTNGLGRLSDAISCTVTEERNGQYELHMEYPADGHLIEEVRHSRIITAIPADDKEPQPFCIYRITKPLSGVIEIDAEHISYQMTHIPIMPFSAVGIAQSLAGLKTYSAETNPFTFTRDGSFGADIGSTFKVSEPDNLRALLFGQEGSLVDTFGGEWEFDGFNAIFHNERGSDNGVTIRYGKNLTELKQDENIGSTYTGICPFWKGTDSSENETVVTLPEKVLHTSTAANYPYQRTKVVDLSSEFQNQPTAAQLRSAGESYIDNNDVGTPAVSLDVSFVALHQTQEYADLTKIEHINLCDTVQVVFPALDVSTKAKVVKTVWNVLLDRYDSITIGAVPGRLSATLQASQEAAVEKAVAQSGSAASTEYATKTALQAVSAAVGQVDTRMYRAEHVYEALTGQNGGYVYITIDANNQTDELIVLVDSPILQTARRVFRFNESGLCYTSGGYSNGSWSTIIASNGQVNAAALYSSISDAAGKNTWNLTNGAFSVSADATFGGKTMAAIISEILATASGNIATAISNYDDSLDQEALVSKLDDEGFYIGQDGRLHMLPERVITDGANIGVAYLPTTIVDGSVTSYTQVRVANGIIYPPVSQVDKEEES